ncbi:MAG TPA: hypothetical protein VGN43_06885 [Steroidobacteraceae bacterium]|nr:hypothetical protein [Steroidobacteraceae bacterium]
MPLLPTWISCQVLAHAVAGAMPEIQAFVFEWKNTAGADCAGQSAATLSAMADAQVT